MLFRQSMIYALGNATQAALAIFLIWVYTRVMSADEFGTYAFVLTNVQFAYQLVMNWVCVSFVRLYHKVSDKEVLLGSYLGLFCVITLLGLIATLALLPFLQSREQAELATLGYFLFVAMTWMELNMRLFQARLQAGRQARARILRSVVTAVLGASLTWYGWGPQGALIGGIVGMAFVGLPQSMKDWKNLPFGGNQSVRAEVWQFGAPLAVSFAIGAASVFAGRYFVVALEGAAVLGAYVLCNEIATRITTLSLSPIGAASASITFFELKEKGQDAVRDRLRYTCLMMLGVVIPGAVGLAIVSADVAVTLVGPEFRADTALILPIIGFAIFAQRFRGEYLDQALHLGLRSDRLLWSSIGTLFVSLVLNYLLVSTYGLIGAAYAALLVSAAGIVLVTLLGRTAFPLPFPMFEVGKIVVATAAMAAGILALPIEPGLMGLIVRIVSGCLIYAAVILALNVAGVRGYLRGKTSTTNGGSESAVGPPPTTARISGESRTHSAVRPDVSIIVPAYNAASTLARAVESALSQEGAQIEVIVIDDCSQDGTRDVARALQAQDERVKLIEKSVNGGISAARNDGLRLARGTWVTPLDADDSYEPGRLAALCHAGQLKNADLMADNLNRCDSNLVKLGRMFMGEIESDEMIDVQAFLRSSMPGSVSLGYMKALVRRSFLEKHDIWYDEGINCAEDWHFYLTCLLHEARLVFVSDAYYNYAIHPSSHSRQRARIVENASHVLLAHERAYDLALRFDQPDVAQMIADLIPYHRRFLAKQKAKKMLFDIPLVEGIVDWIKSRQKTRQLQV